MSIEQPAQVAIDPLDRELPPDDLPEEDGVPLESPWHLKAMVLLIESIEWHWRDRSDFFVGGDMFVYYAADQLKRRHFRGPDFFVVKDVERFRPRRKWEAWKEDSRLPDVIIELLSPSTADEDRTAKKELYERTFRTSEYFLFDPETGEFEGWRLDGRRRYRAIEPDENGQLSSEVLDLSLGTWHGTCGAMESDWPRFFTPAGELVLIAAEAERHLAQIERLRAEAERQRTQAETARADAAVAEVEKLRRELETLRSQRPNP